MDFNFDTVLSVAGFSLIAIAVIVLVFLHVRRLVQHTPKDSLTDEQRAQLIKCGVLHFTKPKYASDIISSGYLVAGDSMNNKEANLVWMCVCTEEVLSSIEAEWEFVRKTRPGSTTCLRIFYSPEIDLSKFKINNKTGFLTYPSPYPIQESEIYKLKWVKEP